MLFGRWAVGALHRLFPVSACPDGVYFVPASSSDQLAYMCELDIDMKQKEVPQLLLPRSHVEPGLNYVASAEWSVGSIFFGRTYCMCVRDIVIQLPELRASALVLVSHGIQMGFWGRGGRLVQSKRGGHQEYGRHVLLKSSNSIRSRRLD
jgi:hypothetical protein